MASRKLSFGTTLAVGAILLLGITVFLNRVVSNLALGRFDMTEGRIYTVSEGAKNVMKRLEVPVQVKYYVTPKDQMPAGLKTLQQEVTDKLSELAIASGGQLEFKIADPTESPEVEEALGGKGIRPFQVQSVERDAVAVKLVYSAISIGYRDKAEEILPQIFPESLSDLEYAIVSNVLKLTRDGPPVVAVHSTKEPVDPQVMSFYLQTGQQPPPPRDNFGAIPQILQQEGYDIRPVEITEGSPVPDEAQTLLVLAPQALNERQRYEIHSVLRRGGNVVVAAQSTTFDLTPGASGGYRMGIRQLPISANDLLTEYGIRIDDRILMDQQAATLAIPKTQSIGFLQFQTTEPVQSPVQIRVMGDGVNEDIALTSGVPEVLYLWGNQLVIDEEAMTENELAVTTIFRGSETCWTLDKKTGFLDDIDEDPAGHPVLDSPTLAVLVEGTFPDPWEGKDVPEWPAAPDAENAATPPADDGADAAGPEEPPATGRLLVIGCSKMFEDNLLQQPGHGLLLLNTVDALTLGEDLIGIRSKRYDRRAFGEVSDGKKLAFRALNLALVPALLALFGLARLVKRRKVSEEYTARFAGGSSS